MEIEQKIKDLINTALSGIGLRSADFAVEHPVDLKMGDYSTNVAMILAKNAKTNPRELADKIVSELQKDLPEEVQKVEAAGAGFINFYLSPQFFGQKIAEISGNKNFGKNVELNGQKIMIEHTQPNPFKAFHIGHLMNNAIGDSVARIVRANGAEVITATYHGDLGLHVAKAIWGIKNKGGNFLTAYSFGHKSYEENENAKKEIIGLNKKLYEGGDGVADGIYLEGLKDSMEYFESMYEKLGSEFQHHFLESEAGEIGKKIVLENVGKVFEEGDGGAVVFKGEKYGLHTRVFLNGEGLPTYEAKEVGLAKIKRDIYKYDQSITITANEQNDFFKVTEVAIGEVFPELRGKLHHLSHGMLRLPTGKMSSRTGDVITAESLIEMLKEKVKGDERVAIGAIKYMILRQSVGGDIVFDIDKSVSTDGDSGVYLQYSHARAHSILEKALGRRPATGEANEANIKPDASIPQGWVTNEVEKLLYRFPEVVARAGEEFAPHYIVSYLTELARSYNSFYGNTQILKEGDETSPYKVALTEAFTIVMKNGLTILGIEAPERM